jgi:hypothetical protein
MGNSYTSASLVEAEIRASTSFSADTTPTLQQLNNWIDEESKIIEVRTGTVFGYSLASSVYMDYDGAEVFRLPNSPVISITSLEYNLHSNNTTPSWVTLEEGFDKNYLLYEDEGEVEFIGGNSATHKVLPKAGKKKFRVSYTYGYEETPLEIQRLASLAVSKRVIMSLLNTQANTQGGNIQVGTISVTDPSNYGVSWFKGVNDEMDNIYSSIGQDLKVFRLTRRY